VGKRRTVWQKRVQVIFALDEEDRRALAHIRDVHGQASVAHAARFCLDRQIAREAARRAPHLDRAAEVAIRRAVMADRPVAGKWNRRLAPEHVEAIERVRVRLRLESRTQAFRFLIRYQAALDGLGGIHA
jgi:hypothetical protein